MQTINEHYHFQTENDVYNFLKTLGEKSWGLVLQTPSGHGFRLYNGEEELRNLAQHWFRFTGMFPYSEKLPSITVSAYFAKDINAISIKASIPPVKKRCIRFSEYVSGTRILIKHRLHTITRAKVSRKSGFSTYPGNQHAPSVVMPFR